MIINYKWLWYVIINYKGVFVWQVLPVRAKELGFSYKYPYIKEALKAILAQKVVVWLTTTDPSHFLLFLCQKKQNQKLDRKYYWKIWGVCIYLYWMLSVGNHWVNFWVLLVLHTIYFILNGSIPNRVIINIR